MDQHPTFTQGRKHCSQLLPAMCQRKQGRALDRDHPYPPTPPPLLHPKDGRHELLTRIEQNYVPLNCLFLLYTCC